MFGFAASILPGEGHCPKETHAQAAVLDGADQWSHCVLDEDGVRGAMLPHLCVLDEDGVRGAMLPHSGFMFELAGPRCGGTNRVGSPNVV